MAKRGPKRARYEEADRPFHVAGLKLMLSGLTANAAAWRAEPEKMEGLGTDSKQRRLRDWLIDTPSRVARLPQWLTEVQTRKEALKYALRQEENALWDDRRKRRKD